MNPMCSVVIPCKNRVDVLLRAVKSALDISIINEIIIVDDLSSPRLSLDIFNRIPNRQKLRIIENVNYPGAQGARVSGAEAANNDIILFLDSDDTLISYGVFELYDVILSSQNIALAYGNVKSGGWVSDFLQVNGDGYRQALKNLSLCCYCGMMVRRSLVPWNELDLTLPAWQDDDFVLCVSRSNKVTFVDTYTACIHGSGDSISSSKHKQFVGLSKLLSKWKSELIREFGYSWLAIWRIRQISLFLYSCGQFFNSTTHQNYFLRRFFHMLGRMSEYLGNFFLNRVRRHFDRIYA